MDHCPNYKFVSAAHLPTRWGQFRIHAFVETNTNQEHIALSYGTWQSDDVVTIRLHSECLTGDALFSLRCDCGFQLETAMQKVVAEGQGVILYLRQEGRGIGLVNKVKAYELQDQGLDTVEANEHLGFDADMRTYEMCNVMLEHLAINQVRLMTNNPRKVAALTDIGINVVERLPIDEGVNDNNRHYIKTKTSKLGHQFDPNKIDDK